MTAVNMADYGLLGQLAVLAQEQQQYQVGRVVAQEKGLYRLISEKGEQVAEISGRMRYNASSASDLPAVGDFVWIGGETPDTRAVIHGVLPRKSVFIRKAAGSACREQVVAANIDTLFLCMSLNNDFNLRRLERYLSVAWSSGAAPVVVLTKSDLCAEIDAQIRAVETVAVGTDILVTSGLAQDGYRQLLPYLQAGRTVALIGSSGVGKSTLINRLLGEERLETNGLRSDDKGRHTTTRRELFLLRQGGMVIDTPGMRELGLWDAEEGLDRSFADVEALTGKCRFHDCSHTTEPGCAIRAALADGTLAEIRWRSYQKLRAESRYTEDSSDYMAQKREKFKSIAKINKLSNKRVKY